MTSVDRFLVGRDLSFRGLTCPGVSQPPVCPAVPRWLSGRFMVGEVSACEYLDTWVAGLRLAESTAASYRKNIRQWVRQAEVDGG